LLFISTERFKFCVLAYDPKTSEIQTRANGDVQDRNGRLADVGQIAIIDPDTKLIGLHLYDGHFKVIPIDQNRKLGEAFNIA
jgi:DNA damage-binding protein 1